MLNFRRKTTMGKEFIRIGGARVHNLKNISLSIPRDRLVVITGPSGSGKSSLAFDTLFAEGQRKYVESLSAYARQFLDQLEKPDVDYIEGLSPAIAIEQRTSAANPRSIIATTTEIFDFLRLIYAHAGQAHCPESGVPIHHMSVSQIVDEVMALPPRTRVMILAPVAQGEKGEFKDVLERLAREGFARARVDGEMVELAAQGRPKLDPAAAHTIEVVVDRLVIDEKVRVRVGDSAQTGLKWGGGAILVLHQPPGAANPAEWAERRLSNRMVSPATGKSFEKPEPRHFSFNSPFGACPTCDGLGQRHFFDAELVVPDRQKSLAEGAIAPWRKGGARMEVYYASVLKSVAAHFQQDVGTPYGRLPEVVQQTLMHGTKEEIAFTSQKGGREVVTRKPFEGVLAQLKNLFQESESELTRNRLKAYMSPRACESCGGRRLRPEILAVTLGGGAAGGPAAEGNLSIPGLSIMDLCGLSVDGAHEFFERLEFTAFQQKIVADPVKAVRARLGFLRQVGLGYLTLNRESGSLSGGEAQRIRLATQIGAGLVGVLYILDEPSIGLHQRDNERLLATLVGLRDLGNTVVVVEHDEDTIRQADHIVDMGPGAGAHGGEVVAEGTLAEILAHSKSLTGRYLSGELSIPKPAARSRPLGGKGWLEIKGARENNLRNLDARFPLGAMTCVTGVSGSGKSTLVDDILRKALARSWHGAKDRPGAHDEILGTELLDKFIVIDQTPIGRTPRSNPATYTGIFNHIRDLFSKLPSARIRGYDAGRFSFNVKGGRCEKCEGDGMIRIEMHFLPPVYVECEACAGRRYNRETLEIAYKGLNIADVLMMTVDSAVDFFRAIPQIHEVCLTLAEVGLGYIHLGQAGTTLSGGEAQRIKLAAELSRKSTGNTLYLLDEPTTGLHFHDVNKLLEVFAKLKAPGNTLLVIEHNLDVIKVADWVLDLGPEGGSGGGAVVVEGPPEVVAACERSHTGRFLKQVLAKR